MLCTLPDESVSAPLTQWSAEQIFSLAAEGLVNAEKPHQGVTGKNAGPHQGATACNSTTALGVSWRLWSGTMPGATVTYDYDAWGNEITVSGTTPNEMMYRGEQYDSDLALYYLRARYYNPLSGRFMSRDPEDGDDSDPISLHKYLYANGDPVDHLDPTGEGDAVEVNLGSLPSRTIVGVAGRAAAATATGFAVGGGIYGFTALIVCSFNADADTLWAVAQNMGSVQTVVYLLSGCTGNSTSPGTGPVSAPSGAGGPGSQPPNPPSPPCSCKPGWHMHHLLPQNSTMKAWFAASPRFLNVDDPQFLVCMPPGAHIGKGGLHPNGWNAEWQAFIDENPDATAQQVLDQLQKMQNEWRFQNPLNRCQE